MQKEQRLNGNLIKKWLAARGRDREYLAQKLKCSESYIHQMVAGRVPGSLRLIQLAKVLKINPKRLIEPKKRVGPYPRKSCH